MKYICYEQKHKLVLEIVSLDNCLQKVLDSVAMLLGQPDLQDLEMLSKVLKYESSELVNYISEHSA